MKTDVLVHVEFKDGRAPADEKLQAEVPPGAERQICVQVLAGFNATGGLMRFLEEGEIGVVFVPMDEIKSIKISVPPIVSSASLGDLTAVANRAKMLDAVAARVKL
jgi:hypothetical protein